MTVDINLNDFVKFKLTDKGKDIYYHQYDEINAIWGRQIAKPHYPKTDANGYTEMQLWDFMRLYGEHMDIGMENVIEPLDLIYETKGVKT